MTFEPDVERVCFSGEIINDVIALEGDEDFYLVLQDPMVGGVLVGERNRTLVIITDDDGK